jgi:hypothetical protein
VDTKFTLLFFLFVALAAFITKRMMSSRDDNPGIEDIVSEIIPILNDPAALHRKVARDLRKKRIRAAGAITDITTSPRMEIVRVRDRVAVQTGGMAGERDVIYELAFMHPDTLDDAGVGQYVEFTGLLIDIAGGSGTPVITVNPGEILYIGDEPPDAAGRRDEDSPDNGADSL